MSALHTCHFPFLLIINLCRIPVPFPIRRKTSHMIPPPPPPFFVRPLAIPPSSSSQRAEKKSVRTQGQKRGREGQIRYVFSLLPLAQQGRQWHQNTCAVLSGIIPFFSLGGSIGDQHAVLTWNYEGKGNIWYTYVIFTF